MPGLRQQEQTDLLDMGTRCNVDQVVVLFRIEFIVPSEFMQRPEDFFEVPWVLKFDLLQADFGFRRHSGDIFARGPGECLVTYRVQQLEPIDQ